MSLIKNIVGTAIIFSLMYYNLILLTDQIIAGKL